MIAADKGNVADAAAHLLGWAAVGCTTCQLELTCLDEVFTTTTGERYRYFQLDDCS
jgi:hypothetical protein